MGLIKKVTVLSLISATVAGILTKILSKRKYEIEASKMSLWECRKRDLKKSFLNFIKRWKSRKDVPHKWKKFFKFA